MCAQLELLEKTAVLFISISIYTSNSPVFAALANRKKESEREERERGGSKVQREEASTTVCELLDLAVTELCPIPFLLYGFVNQYITFLDLC